jgi:phospholipid/cholesterol/gamma-HCH transport system permease protein
MTSALQELGRFGLFMASFVQASTSRPPPIRASIVEAYRIGVLSLPILLIISMFVGTNLALQGHSAFAPLGGQRLVGMFVALAGVREMAPIMVAAMVAAKAGTEMASQIAVMRIRDQIDALEVMAINPLWYLVTPRFLGILLVLPALTMISIFTLTVSAYGVAVFQLGLDGAEFLDYFAQATILSDFLFCGVKAFFFAVVICFVSCFYGFHCKPGPDGVGGATNSAVVVSAVVCAVLNYLLSELLFGGRGL